MKALYEISQTDYRLRKCIGFLGIFLPTIIWLFHDQLLASISHYYYTNGSVFFIGILFSFALILLSYKGHKPKKDEFFSDNILTNLAGLFALATVIIPTSCCNSGDETLKCIEDYLFGHQDGFFNTIHLICAGLFIFILGWMCIFKFTKSTRPERKKYNKLYKVCGYIVWTCVALIAFLFAIDKWTQLDLDTLIPGYTFILESIALYAFAIAWLVKGHLKEDWLQLKQRLLF